MIFEKYSAVNYIKISSYNINSIQIYKNKAETSHKNKVFIINHFKKITTFDHLII